MTICRRMPRGRGHLAGALAAVLVLGAAGAKAQGAAYLPGRLFLTPAERAQLDALRAARPQRAQVQTQPEAQTGGAPTIELPPPPPPEPFTMNGLVVRSSGPSTAWIDGQPVLGPQQTDKGVRIDTHDVDGDGVPVTVLESGHAVTLKPGQTYLPEQDAVTERPRAAPDAKAARP